MYLYSKKIIIAVAALALLPLTACEGLGGWEERDPTVQTTDTSTGKPMEISSSRLDNAPGVTPVPNFPVPQDRDLKVMTNKLSGGSVEIYNLDDNTTAGAPVAPVQADYAGIPLATDPRVTVYPLDGSGGTYPGQLAMNPPEKTWPNSVLPVSPASAPRGMTPPPSAWGGDQPMDIVAGKLSPRVGTDVSSVYFNYGSAKLGSPERNALTSVAETAKFAPVDRVSVEGFASANAQTNDPVKAKILNLKESMNRAQSVSSNLIENGVPPEKIKTVAWGDTRPVPGNEASQRRVDVVTGAASGF